MTLLLFNKILADKTILALCWMLIHSIWIGMAMSVISSFIILFTQNKKAKTRYNLLIINLLLFLISNLFIFIYELKLTKGLLNNEVSIGSLNNSVVNIFKSIQYSHFPIVEQFIFYLNNHADYIVNIWLLFIIFSIFRSSFDFYILLQIRKKAIVKVTPYWNAKIIELTKNIEIDKVVQFFESGIAKTPMVIGYLKPIILFPIGLLAALPSHEIEAILLHELGHIKRNDYLINILQSCLETIFFFNPFVWWVSAQVRAERENCCDDIAIAITQNTKNYIQALVSFQEFRFAQPNYSLGFLGNKNQLMKRVLRLVKQKNKSINQFEQTIATLFLSVLVVFLFVAIQIQLPKKEGEKINFKKIAEKENSSHNPLYANKLTEVKTLNPKTIVDQKKIIVQQPKEHKITYFIESTTTKTVNTNGEITKYVYKTKPLRIELKSNKNESILDAKNIIARQLVNNYKYDTKLERQLQKFIAENLVTKNEGTLKQDADSLNQTKRKFSKNKIGISSDNVNIDFEKYNRGTLKYDGIIRYFADSYEVVMKNKELKALYFEGSKIPQEKISDYSEKIKEVIKKAIT